MSNKIHPIACIQQAKHNYQYGNDKPIKLKTTPSSFVSVKSDIQNRIKQFNHLTTASMAEHTAKDTSETTELKGFQDIARRDILYSAISQDFISKYTDDIDHEETYEKLLQFIVEIVGSQTEKQRINEAKLKLNTANRNVEDNERFVRFLDKIKRIADPISSNEEIKKYLVIDAFNKNINRGLRTFLHEHEKSDLSVEETAKYLDKMNKHKSVQVNQIDIDVATRKIEELCDQNTKLQSQNSSIEEKLDSLKTEMKQMIAAAIAQSTIEINKIQTAKKRSPAEAEQSTTRAAANHGHPHFRAQPARRQFKWELDRFGKPIICNKCGWKGHKAADCLGLIRCSKCHEQGHVISICPKLAQNTQAKNM